MWLWSVNIGQQIHCDHYWNWVPSSLLREHYPNIVHFLSFSVLFSKIEQINKLKGNNWIQTSDEYNNRNSYENSAVVKRSVFLLVVTFFPSFWSKLKWMRQKVALQCDWTVYECNNNNRTFRHHKIINLKQIRSEGVWTWTTTLSKHALHTVPDSFYFTFNLAPLLWSPFSARTANTAKSKTIAHWHLANITNKYQRTSFNSKQIAYACLNLFMVDWTKDHFFSLVHCFFAWLRCSLPSILTSFRCLLLSLHWKVFYH